MNKWHGLVKESIHFWLRPQINESFENGCILVKEQMKWFDERIYSVLVTHSNQKRVENGCIFGERTNEMVWWRNLFIFGYALKSKRLFESGCISCERTNEMVWWRNLFSVGYRLKSKRVSKMDVFWWKNKWNALMKGSFQFWLRIQIKETFRKWMYFWWKKNKMVWWRNLFSFGYELKSKRVSKVDVFWWMNKWNSLITEIAIPQIEDDFERGCIRVYHMFFFFWLNLDLLFLINCPPKS